MRLCGMLAAAAVVAARPRPWAPRALGGLAALGPAAALVASVAPWSLPGTSIGGGLPAGYEPSGAVWHTRLNKLFIVGDGGQVSSMNADGSDVVTWYLGGDLEGICIADPESDSIYVGVEGQQVVHEVNIVTHAITDTFDFRAMGASANAGLEALTFVPDPNHPEGGVFYAGLQADGTIHVFNAPVKSSGRGLTSEQLGVLTPAPGISDISGLHYDSNGHILYAIFDSANIMLAMRTDGTRIAGWSLPGNTQEGVALSADALFIAQDRGQVYRYDLQVTPTLCAPLSSPPRIVFVDARATGGLRDGTSWPNAFVDLQNALCVAAAAHGAIEEIWVAAGRYTPGGGDERRRTFQLVNGVGLYGGFAGGETERHQRDPAVNVTELTGEDARNVLRTTYMHHVVTAGTPINGIDETTILDGFTITAGVADGPGGEFVSHHYGAGLYNDGGSPTIADCTFRDNSAFGDPTNVLARAFGGGMYDTDGHATLINCVFTGNRADRGAGLYTSDSCLTLFNCTVAGNEAAQRGGGIYISAAGPTIVNCVFWNNQHRAASDASAQIYGGTPDVRYSNIQDADSDDTTLYPGVGNIDDDPLFMDTEVRNFHLLHASPCVDAGDNSAVPADATDLDGDGDTNEPAPFDLDGRPRFQGRPDAPDTGNGTPPIVDMGAYELPGAPTLVRIVGGTEAVDDAASMVWPKAEDVGLLAFEIEADQPVSLVGWSAITTEDAPAPGVSAFSHIGGDIHRLEITRPIPVGEWTVFTLTVAGAAGPESTFELCLGHLPDDINGDGAINMNDATAFGLAFGTATDAADRNRIDLNNDGQTNLNDATLFGQLWNGTSGHDTWRDVSLPPKP